MTQLVNAVAELVSWVWISGATVRSLIVHSALVTVTTPSLGSA
jgi:hypothetical protein